MNKAAHIEIYTDVKDEYIDLLPAEEQHIYYDEWLEPRGELMQQFRSKIDRWFIDYEQRPSVKGNESHRSNKSVQSGYVATTASSAILKQAQKIAELKTMEAGPQRKTELAQARLKLEVDTERFQIEEQLAIANAKSVVIDTFVHQYHLPPLNLRRPRKDNNMFMPLMTYV